MPDGRQESLSSIHLSIPKKEESTYIRTHPFNSPPERGLSVRKKHDLIDYVIRSVEKPYLPAGRNPINYRTPLNPSLRQEGPRAKGRSFGFESRRVSGRLV